jgi:dTDP-glucose 4,6-dehydratase
MSDEIGPVNIGNPDEITILDFAEEIRGLIGSESEVVFRELPKDDPQVRRPNIGRAREKLGWTPRIGRAEGLRRTLAYFNDRVEYPASH